MDSESSTIRSLNFDVQVGKDPLLQLMELNADVGGFIKEHYSEEKEKDWKVAEERAKSESQRLMKLVFQFENEFDTVEEDSDCYD